MSYYYENGKKVYGTPYTYQGEASDWTAEKALDKFGFICCPSGVKSLKDISEHCIFADIVEEKDGGVVLQTYARYGYMLCKPQKELSDESFREFYRPCSEVKKQIKERSNGYELNK